jgi:hypothetical protein
MLENVAVPECGRDGARQELPVVGGSTPADRGYALDDRAGDRRVERCILAAVVVVADVRVAGAARPQQHVEVPRARRELAHAARGKPKRERELAALDRLDDARPDPPS